MLSMDRRQFLKAIGFGAAAFALPGFGSAKQSQSFEPSSLRAQGAFSPGRSRSGSNLNLSQVRDCHGSQGEPRNDKKKPNFFLSLPMIWAGLN